ncbi:TPA: OmpA family protein [Vibrio vulnificus]
MKKNIVYFMLSSIVLYLLTISLASASWSSLYFGGKVGYVGLDKFCYDKPYCEEVLTGIGIYSGYYLNNNVSAELNIDLFGVNKINLYQGYPDKAQLSIYSLSPKFSLILSDELDVFAKIGTAYTHYEKESDFIPIVSLGVEYELNERLKARIEYQRYQNISDKIINEVDVNYLAIGLTYYPRSINNNVFFETKITKELKEEKLIVEQSEWITKFSEPQKKQEFFSINSSELSVSSKKTLVTLAQILIKYPYVEATIVGHTDSTGSKLFNQYLSEKRANAVADYLKSQGVKTKQLRVYGKGEFQPIASNKSAEGRAKNRRVEVIVPSFKYQEHQL